MGDSDLIRRGDVLRELKAQGYIDASKFVRALPAAPAEDVRAGALKEAAARLDLAAGVFADRAKDTISTNPLSAHPTDTPTEGQLLAYDYDNMQAMLDGAAAAALRAERDAILALIPEAKPIEDVRAGALKVMGFLEEKFWQEYGVRPENMHPDAVLRELRALIPEAKP